MFRNISFCATPRNCTNTSRQIILSNVLVFQICRATLKELYSCFKQWTAVDRSSLETVSQQSDDLIETFCEKLEAHSFIASQQSKFFDESKSSLKPDEIICADFWENYAFILQCSAHGFLWNNAQATIHPFVTYYRESDSSLYNNLTFFLYPTL